HVIRCRPVHTAVRRRKTAPDVASADHYGDFHAQIAYLFHAFGDFAHDRGRDIVARAVLMHSFAAHLEHDAFIDWRFWFHGGGGTSKQKTATFGKQNAKDRQHR